MLEPYKYYVITAGGLFGDIIISLPDGPYRGINLKQIIGLELILSKNDIREIPQPKIPNHDFNKITIPIKAIKSNKYYFVNDLSTVIFKVNDIIYVMNPRLTELPSAYFIFNCYEIPFPTMAVK